LRSGSVGLFPWGHRHSIGATAILGFQEHEDKFRRWIVLGDHTLGVFVTVLLDAFLGKVGEREQAVC
jgi:hypothetical protein